MKIVVFVRIMIWEVRRGGKSLTLTKSDLPVSYIRLTNCKRVSLSRTEMMVANFSIMV